LTALDESAQKFFGMRRTGPTLSISYLKSAIETFISAGCIYRNIDPAANSAACSDFESDL
jgi:hypothetical protein